MGKYPFRRSLADLNNNDAEAVRRAINSNSNYCKLDSKKRTDEEYLALLQGDAETLAHISFECFREMIINARLLSTKKLALAKWKEVYPKRLFEIEVYENTKLKKYLQRPK